MVDTQTLIRTVEALILIGGVSAVIFATFRAKTTAQTISELKTLVDVQGAALQELRIQCKEDQLIIGKLQGEINTLKNLPLTDIEKSLKLIQEQDVKQTEVLQQISDTQVKMLKKLGE